jgi:hypothetical protein
METSSVYGLLLQKESRKTLYIICKKIKTFGLISSFTFFVFNCLHLRALSPEAYLTQEYSQKPGAAFKSEHTFN